MRSKLLISKDVLRADYLSCYGGKLYETKNIDILAKKGLIFKNFYTAAPSSGMAYTAMFTGLNIYELKRGYFHDVKQFDQCPTLFQLLEEKGYDTHVIWDKHWFESSRKKAMVFSEKTHFHNLSISQSVGPHFDYERGKDKRIKSQQNVDPVGEIVEEATKILESKARPVFIWVHCPHCFAGRTGYGSDIDMFDELVGRLMTVFKGDMYLTADHGHMNGEKGIPCYGFHVYQGAVKIPLITPNYFGKEVIEIPLSNIQLINIILEGKLDPQEFIYSDSRYFLQPDRKLMIIKGDFKYIYNKKGKTEELYDLKYDPNENVNLLLDKIKDVDRMKDYFFDEVHYYPRWEDAKQAYFELKGERELIWRTGSRFVHACIYLREIKRKGILTVILTYFKTKKKVKGRWGSRAKTDLSKK